MYKFLLYFTLAWIAYPGEGGTTNEVKNTNLPDERKINDDEALPVAESRLEIEVKILTQMVEKVHGQLEKIDETISHFNELEQKDGGNSLTTPDEGCKWTLNHDGQGASEEEIGKYDNALECATECKKRRNSNSKINGATIRKSDGMCWCEIGMNEKTPSSIYNTCYLPQPEYPVLPGKTRETAAESCLWLNERFRNLRSGRYWIKVGYERKPTYCEMEGEKVIRFPNAIYGEDNNRTTEYGEYNNITGYYIQGHVEILHRNEWGTICDDYFDYNNHGAEVLCRMGGYKSGVYDGGRYKQRSATKSWRIWLDDVRCRGTESNIDECYHSYWGDNNCRHSEDVGIRCYI